jgi:hypothetical protein
VLEIQRAKEIKGKVELPPNPDYFLLTLLCALASNKPAHITPLDDTPLTALFKDSFSSLLDIKQEQSTCMVSPKPDGGSTFILLPYDELPFRDFIVFLLLGLGKTVAFRNVSPKRLEAWQQRACVFGCTIESKQYYDSTGISLSSNGGFTMPDEIIDQNSIHPCIGLAFGQKKKLSLVMDHQLQSPLRHILPSFGYDVLIKSNYDKKDPLARRLRFLAPKTAKKTDSKQTFTVSADFSLINPDPVSVTLPGDDVLGSLLLEAKSLIQRGQLIIANAPLEPWSCATLNYIRKMGCNEGIQEERRTSFGSTGMVYLQSFKCYGHKMDCIPLYHYQRQLPAIVTIATFAKGQSVFRGLEDLRNETPDAIEKVLACVRCMGGRHGEMPDGIVIDGAKQFDGFDLKKPLSAAQNGACAVAGLKCNGKTLVEDSLILQRWPSFSRIVDGICIYKTG